MVSCEVLCLVFNLQCWHQCAASVKTMYHSHTKTRNVKSLHHHHSWEPSYALSELTCSFVTQNPSDLCSPLSARVRGNLGDVWTASLCVSCYLYCPGLAEELGSCSPPDRRMWEEDKMVL